MGSPEPQNVERATVLGLHAFFMSYTIPTLLTKSAVAVALDRLAMGYDDNPKGLANQVEAASC